MTSWASSSSVPGSPSRRRRSSLWRLPLVGVLAATGVLVSCGDDDDGASGPATIALSDTDAAASAWDVAVSVDDGQACLTQSRLADVTGPAGVCAPENQQDIVELSRVETADAALVVLLVRQGLKPSVFPKDDDRTPSSAAPETGEETAYKAPVFVIYTDRSKLPETLSFTGKRGLAVTYTVTP